jgi:hypothetical protein
LWLRAFQLMAQSYSVGVQDARFGDRSTNKAVESQRLGGALP